MLLNFAQISYRSNRHEPSAAQFDSLGNILETSIAAEKKLPNIFRNRIFFIFEANRRIVLEHFHGDNIWMCETFLFMLLCAQIHLAAEDTFLDGNKNRKKSLAFFTRVSILSTSVIEIFLSFDRVKDAKSMATVNWDSRFNFQKS